MEVDAVEVVLVSGRDRAGRGKAGVEEPLAGSDPGDRDELDPLEPVAEIPAAADVADEQRLPFDVKVPNAESVRSMTELTEGKGKRHKNAAALFKDLGL